jgi:hypothetical protein
MIKFIKKLFKSNENEVSIVIEQKPISTHIRGGYTPVAQPSVVLKEKKPNKHAHIISKEVCECCGNATVTYRRKIGYSILKPLTNAWMYCKKTNLSYFHIQNTQSEDYNMNTDLAKARYYGIIESAIIDGKKHVGLWKFTEFGVKFMRNQVKVQEYFILRNGDLKGFEGEQKSYLELFKK